MGLVRSRISDGVDMQSKIWPILAVAILELACLPMIQASSVVNDFNVSVTLSAQCRAMDNGTRTLDFGTYSAFQTTPLKASGIEIGFECTRGLIPSGIDFDSANGTAVGGGVLAGLNYDMKFAAPVVTTGNAASAALAGAGTADLRTYAISGTMNALQAGELSQPAHHTRMLIVTF